MQDPTSPLITLAETSGMANRFHALSLGQGQAPIATRMIKEGVKEVSTIPKRTRCYSHKLKSRYFMSVIIYFYQEARSLQQFTVYPVIIAIVTHGTTVSAGMVLSCQQAWYYSVSRHGAVMSAGMVLQCQ